MAAVAYRKVGPNPQRSHWICDTVAEMLACPALSGDTGYAKDTDEQYIRNDAGWRRILTAPVV